MHLGLFIQGKIYLCNVFEYAHYQNPMCGEYEI